jgi:hypothetical protein
VAQAKLSIETYNKFKNENNDLMTPAKNTIEGEGDENNDKNFSKDWLQRIPSYDLQDAFELHNQTLAALKQSKWSIVAVPHNITGPPIDVTKLDNMADKDNDKNHQNNKIDGIQNSSINRYVFIIICVYKYTYIYTYIYTFVFFSFVSLIFALFFLL